MPATKHPASFRDPSGFIFKERDQIYRQINSYYKKEYDHLMKSGLYGELVEKGVLLPHKEISAKCGPGAYKIIKPKQLSFISYPYEWSFSQLKDAALLTLAVQKIAMNYGMSLKDSSAYNVQFHDGKPIFIDTLSFEMLSEPPKPWVAYRQYCQHFLAPLLLMAKRDVNLSKLMREYIDGIPLDLASELLPAKTRASFRINAHIHWHASLQKRHAGSAKAEIKEKTISRNALVGIIGSLEKTTQKVRWQPSKTEWGEYYTFTNYTGKSFKEKRQIIEKYLAKAKPKTVWDLGANNGLFSRLASDKGISTVAFDIDPIAVEANYLRSKELNEANITPILMDLTNSSPALGWAHEERQSLEQRGPADLIMALALIHHLAISNNLPLESVANYFARLGEYLIIEFVPKGDSQVDKLLATREDIFPAYNEKGFEAAFALSYKILQKNKIKGSKRTLYLMRRK